MFGNNIVGGITGSGLSISKVLGGISKTLNFANQAIPIYNQVKPIVKNVRFAYNVIKDSSILKKGTTTNATSSLNEIQLTAPNPQINRPSFFQ